MASSHHVLLIGGHGKVAQLLTPLLLKRSWSVTSIIRTPEQAPAVSKLGENLPGKLRVLVCSVGDVSTQEQAAAILKDLKPDFVAWAAGAGGKGGPEATYKVDRDAAIKFIHAAASVPSITRFLLISYSGSRRAGAAWWPSGEWDEYNQSVNHNVLATYYQAKIAADEALYEASKKSSTLVGIDLRPGVLTEEPAGRVELGKTKHVKGNVSRATVAAAADALLAADGVRSGWIDLLDGEEDLDAAVARVVREGVDSAEGEAIYTNK
ncbi:hypothetical protein E4U50_006415 [Claviceps purpurea]|nr:hypothetical protein E4U37_005825 [Claviceps purpurea]KAG6188341.1 hypothetical protein E4U36_006947 [Claviceps purpurea]KAG6202144.1 hypothetical protein E4U50_006415 [Claviceps purpurea]